MHFSAKPELTLEQRLQLRLELLEEQVAELKAANEQLEHRLHTEAKIDPLTGLNNRRGFEHAIEPILHGLPRRPKPEDQRKEPRRQILSILMLDIDRFKDVNDVYGHDVGDQVLRLAGVFLKTQIRNKKDAVARHGGEEFVIAFYGASAADVIRHFKPPGEKYATLRFDATVVHAETPITLRVSFSGGVATHIPGEPYSETIRRADIELLSAKDAGRGRIYKAKDLEPKRAVCVSSGSASPEKT